MKSPAAANTIWILSERAIRLAVGLVVGVWVARYLGPEQYGVLSFGIAWVALFSTIATLGLPHVLTRDLSLAPDSAGVLLSTAGLLRLAGGVACLFLATGIFAAFHGTGDPRMWVVLPVATGTVFHAGDVIEYWFRSRVEWKYVFRVRLITLGVATFFRIVLVLAERNVLWIAAVIPLEAALTAGLLLVQMVLHGSRVKPGRPSGEVAARLVRDGFPVLLAGVAIMVYTKIDQVMIGIFLANYEVGVYAVAVRLATVWYVIPTAITQSVLPGTIAARDRSRTEYEGRIIRVVALLFWCFLGVAAAVTFSGPLVIRVLLGEEYGAAGPALQIHIWSGLGVSVGVAIQQWYLAENRLEIDLYRTVAGAVVNLGLNLILIPRAGIFGAALATVAAQVVAAYLSAAWFPTARDAWRLLNAGIAYPFRTVR